MRAASFLTYELKMHRILLSYAYVTEGAYVHILQIKYVFIKVPQRPENGGMCERRNVFPGRGNGEVIFGQHSRNGRGTKSIILVKKPGIFRFLKFHCFKFIIIINSIM